MLKATAITGVECGNGLSCLVCSWVANATTRLVREMGHPFFPSGLPWRSRQPSSANGHRRDVGEASSGHSRGCRSVGLRVIDVRCTWCLSELSN